MRKLYPILLFLFVIFITSVTATLFIGNKNFITTSNDYSSTNINTINLISGYNITDICTSSDGRYVYAIATNGTDGAILSTDNVATYMRILYSNEKFTNIACSQDGQYVYAGLITTKYPFQRIYRSFNYGVSFYTQYLELTGAGFTQVSTSYSGQSLSVFAYNNTESDVLYSSTHGDSFSYTLLNFTGVQVDEIYGGKSVTAYDGDISFIAVKTCGNGIQDSYKSTYLLLLIQNLRTGALTYYNKELIARYLDGVPCITDKITDIKIVNPANILYTFTYGYDGFIYPTLTQLIWNNSFSTPYTPYSSVDIISPSIQSSDIFTVFDSQNIIYNLNKTIYRYGFVDSLFQIANYPSSMYGTTPATQNNTQPQQPLCIDNHNLCLNPIYISGSLYCAINDTSYCVDSCTNMLVDNATKTAILSTYNNCDTLYNSTTRITGLKYRCSLIDNIGWYQWGYILSLDDSSIQFVDCLNISLSQATFTVPYTTCSNSNVAEILYNNPNTIYTEKAICSQGSQLPNECNILGYQECDSSTSFKICGQWGTNNRLTYQSGFSCQLNQVCRAGYCINNNATGQTTQATFNVQPYTADDDNTKYSLDNINKIVHVNTRNLIHNQKFSTTSSVVSYTSRTCNYQETSLYTDTTEYTTSYKQNILTTPITSTATLNLIITLPDNTNATINLNNTIGQNIINYTIVRNDTLNSVCVYNSIGVIYCSYGINQYDFKGFNLTLIFDYGSSSYTATFGFLRTQDEYIYNNPILFNSNVGQIEETGNNVTQKSLIIKTFTQPNGYTNTLQNNYDFLNCIGSQVGCKIVRTYVNLDGLPTFTKYQDWNICIDSTNNANPNTPIDDIGKGLSTNTKYLIMLISSVIAFLAVMIMGMVGHDGKAGVLGGLVLSMLISLTLSIVFSLSLLIPILYIIIGGAIVAFIIRKTSTG